MTSAPHQAYLPCRRGTGQFFLLRPIIADKVCCLSEDGRAVELAAGTDGLACVNGVPDLVTGCEIAAVAEEVAVGRAWDVEDLLDDLKAVAEVAVGRAWDAEDLLDDFAAGCGSAAGGAMLEGTLFGKPTQASSRSSLTAAAAARGPLETRRLR